MYGELLVTRKTDPARKAVLRQLSSAHGRFLVLEQAHVTRGEYGAAQTDHEFGMVILRAYKAESDDPEPVRR